MSVLLPSMRGALGTGGAATIPEIGNRVFWWDTAGYAGGSFTDTGATLPATDNTRVASIKGAIGQIYSRNNTGQRPLFLNNRQNSLPGLYFSQARGDNLGNPTLSLPQTMSALSGMTILTVWRPNSGTFTAQALSFGTGGAGGNGSLILSSTSSGGGGITAGIRNDTSAAIAEPDDLGHASAALIVYDRGGNSLTLLDNHGNDDTVAPTLITSWADGYIGGALGVSGTWEGDLFEIVMWDQLADAGQQTAALAYAESKWALA